MNTDMPKKQLSWQPAFSPSRKPVKKSIRRPKRGPAGTGDGPRQFEFITEYPVTENGLECSLSNTPCTAPDLSIAEAAQDAATDDLTSTEAGGSPPPDDYGMDSWASTNPVPLLRGTEHPEPLRIETARLIRAASISDAPDITYPIFSAPPLSILYNDTSHRFEAVLDRYNREFCKIPLTSDLLQVNPFRYSTGLNPGPLCLVHAVMALAGHHVESTSTQHHRHVALRLLRENLSTYDNSADDHHILDTIVILFSFDETQSALGNWSIHLMGTYALLESSGGMKKWLASARAAVQVGLMIWWDAITSLVSREDCVFPYAYFDAIKSDHDEKEWDYFRLCGCPLPLVEIIMRLARLGAEKRKSTSMQYVIFDNTVVSELELSLESWHYASPPSAYQNEESMQQDQDRMHCSEAWRNGLLLYVYRVFQWEPGTAIPIRVLSHARIVADHIFACRDDSMVARQALLPLFFAGCELRDESIRRKIVEYCSFWNNTTRYYMFSSTVPLLEGVWAEQEKRGVENVWWGQIVDRQHAAAESQNPLQMRLCFG